MNKYLHEKKLMEYLSWDQLLSHHSPTRQEHGEEEPGESTFTALPSALMNSKLKIAVSKFPSTLHSIGCFLFIYIHTLSHNLLYIHKWYACTLSAAIGLCVKPFGGCQMTVLLSSSSHSSLGLDCLQLHHLALLQDFLLPYQVVWRHFCSSSFLLEWSML